VTSTTITCDINRH